MLCFLDLIDLLREIPGREALKLRADVRSINPLNSCYMFINPSFTLLAVKSFNREQISLIFLLS